MRQVTTLVRIDTGLGDAGYDVEHNHRFRAWLLPQLICSLPTHRLGSNDDRQTLRLDPDFLNDEATRHNR